MSTEYSVLKDSIGCSNTRYLLAPVVGCWAFFNRMFGYPQPFKACPNCKSTGIVPIPFSEILY